NRRSTDLKHDPNAAPGLGPSRSGAGRTTCAAGDTIGAGRLEGLHRQLVTTGDDRCQPVGTADGARGSGTPLAVAPHRDARAGLVVGAAVGGHRGGGKGGRGQRPATVGQPLPTRDGRSYCERAPGSDRRLIETLRLFARAVGALATV